MECPDAIPSVQVLTYRKCGAHWGRPPCAEPAPRAGGGQGAVCPVQRSGLRHPRIVLGKTELPPEPGSGPAPGPGWLHALSARP